MGAGQIGGVATLLDIDFNNPAHFLGEIAGPSEGQFIVGYLSHAMMFCVGALIEAHVVLTPASCVYGERYKFDVHGGTHKFVENAGVTRQVNHLCLHKAYNHTNRMKICTPDNVALLVLSQQFSFNKRELGADFIINRVRYGLSESSIAREGDKSCRFFGWGSRRNGYLVPLLINLRRMDVTIMPSKHCLDMWNYQQKYLCIYQPQCKSEKYGALCPDDMGTVLVCSGLAHGMMTSRLVDRPCGVGFLDLTLYNKFLTCGVDDSRDVIDHEDSMVFEFDSKSMSTTPLLATPSQTTPSIATPEEQREQPTEPEEFFTVQEVTSERRM